MGYAGAGYLFADCLNRVLFMNERLAFLKKVTPFNLLPDEVLKGTASLLQEITYSKDAVLYQQEVTPMKGVDIIVKGEYESFFYDSGQNKRLIEYHHEGYCYGGISVLLNRKQSLRTVIVKKGTVVYFLPRKDFKALCQAYEDFFHHFTIDFGKRMLNDEFAHFFKRPASFEESYIASDQLYSRRVENIEQRAIVSCPGSTPVYEAARLMAANKVSCLFVTGEQQQIIGYVTDITLRDNVIAKQGSTTQPVQQVMDNPIVTISSQAYVYEAVLMMFRTKTRYLLVEHNGSYTGFLSRNKLLSEQAQSPLVFIQSVKSAGSADELKRKWEQVPAMLTQLLGRGVHAEIANQVITTVSDTIALKVIEGVIDEMGTPPAKFVFMVLGSEGRKEQTLKTDQDNAIIYEDKANEHREEVRAYFLSFAQKVSERLNHIGFSYCTGGFMAQNPKWTHSLSHWKRNYESWMLESVPETVIKFSTFFDCRYIYGEAAIMDELKAFLDEELQKPQEKLFFHMAKNALQYEPPLTFFKNIRTFTKGKQEVFDIKKAMTPIVDMARVYALRHRVFEVNTGDRLKALKEKGVFTEKAYQELTQSYYFLMGMRLKNQARQIMIDKTEPDNYINLNTLTRIEQLTLREIFKTIENFQTGIKVAFTNNLFG
jgi:CBS domain-containing protein